MENLFVCSLKDLEMHDLVGEPKKHSSAELYRPDPTSFHAGSIGIPPKVELYTAGTV